MLKKLFGEQNMGRKQKNIWLRIISIFCIMIIAFVLMLTLVMCIPNSAIKQNYDRSMEVFEQEGDGWNRVYTYASGSMIDNLTDRIIISGTMVNDNCSPLSNALSGNGYSRYWHGYLVWVRPLLVLFSYLDIRYILMVVLMFLLTACTLGLNDRLGRGTAWIFTLCMVLAYFIMVPWSLQFCEVFLVTMTALVYITKRYSASKTVAFTGEMFLIIGMVTQYLDFLTAPLVTLGLPLCAVLLINAKELGRDSIIKNWAVLIHSCITWAVGWAAGWAAKWIVGTAILRRNIIEDALNQASFRVSGNDTSKVSRITALAKNIYSAMPFSNVIGKGEKGAMILVAALYIAVFVLMAVLWIKYRKKTESAVYLPIAATALLPVAWVIVMGQHSQIHFFYTYRMFIISWFALLTAYAGCIDWRALKCSISGMKKNRS